MKKFNQYISEKLHLNKDIEVSNKKDFSSKELFNFLYKAFDDNDFLKDITIMKDDKDTKSIIIIVDKLTTFYSLGDFIDKLITESDYSSVDINFDRDSNTISIDYFGLL